MGQGNSQNGRVSRWRSTIVELLAALALVFIFAAPALAQSSAPGASFLRGSNTPTGVSDFDHSKTGFPLTNAHASLACESCHISGKFKNTPRTCDGCHNGAVTTGMPANHPPTTQKCDGCHQTSGFKDITTIDHTQASTNCAACHDGIIAKGKSANHIPTIAPCDTCHKNSVNFSIAVKFDHTGITDGCAACHNGVRALGKTPNHVPTSLPCEACHFSTVTFLGAIYQHTASDVNCVSCHNGTIAKGEKSPPHVPIGGAQCSACHANSDPSFNIPYYAMDHSAVVPAERCDACHGGAFVGEGSKGAAATTSYPGHVATAGRDCVACHAKAQSGGYVSWAGTGTYVHAASDTNCSNCHNGVTATGHTTPPHIPVTGVQCSNCHANTDPSFNVPYYTMNHGAVVGAERCDACHNGTFVGQGAKGAIANTSYPGHVATGGRDCVTCHAKAQSGGYVSWAGTGAYVHAAGDTNCVNCHNGTTATGHTTPPHIPVTGVQCSNCHANTDPSFNVPYYAMNHGAVTSSRCDACHNGAYAGQGTKGAYGTASYANHIATGGRDCVQCHAAAVSGGFVSWASGTYVHLATDTNCSNCHNGVTAIGQSTNVHIPTGNVQCSNCHSSANPSFNVPYYTMTHGAVVPAVRCDACHNGAYTGQGATGATGTASYPGHVATAGRDCVACHAKAQSGGYVSWKGTGGYVHQASDTNCSSCHNGTTATGQTSPPHIPINGAQCSNCHVNTDPAFTIPYYTMTHGAVVPGLRCDSCHNGSFTGQGSTGAIGTASFPGHVATSGQDCVACHAAAQTGGYVSWVKTGTYVHQASDTNCSSCHNGTTATGQTSPPHIPINGAQCSNCHASADPSFTIPYYAMSHGAVVPGLRCDACHNGAFTGQGSTGATGTASYPGHVATTGRDCVTCHAAAQTGGYVSWAKTGTYVHQASDTNCSSCHNGTTATGQTSPPHIPINGAQCSNCHASADPSFTIPYYAMSHGAVVPAERCDACHNGNFTGQGSSGAVGTASYPGHVATSGQDCVTCHAAAQTGGYVSWAKTGVYVHAAIDTNCSSCHNGTTATGQTSPPHIPINGAQCSNCHASADPSFTIPYYTMTHGAVVPAERCDACHNGNFTGQGSSGAVGTASYPGHVATNGQDCVACHAAAQTGGYVSWAKTGTYVHQASDTNCSSCHNGTTATGQTSPPHIPINGAQCSNCHSSADPAFTVPYYGMAHGAVVPALRCDACHNGTFTGQGSNGAIGTASYPGHVATNGQDCVACHAAAQTGGYVSWAKTGVYVHQASDTNCSACHNGVTATGQTSPPHIPINGVQCSNCHANTNPSFTIPYYSMSHAAVVPAERCDSCHNGTFTGQGSNGAIGTASYPGHVATSGQDCVACHAAAQTGGYVSWAKTGVYVHQASDTNCSTCHNGVTATGETTPPHIPVSGVQCSNCHSSADPSFTVPYYSMSHGAVVPAERCDACHNGTFTGQGASGAIGTASYQGHVATGGQDCVVCHAKAQTGGYVSWSGTGTYVHSAADTNCSTCHNGVIATGQTSPPHIPINGAQCSNCHMNTYPSFNIPYYAMIHDAVVPALRCDGCHNGTFTGQGSSGAIGTASYSGHVATGGQDCVVCHAKAQTGGYVSWSGTGTYVHSATDTNCSSCHNGVTATGQTSPPHIPINGAQCSNCHVNTNPSFTVPYYTMTHTAVVPAERCDACHNGTFTGQGSSGAIGTASYQGHVATNGQDCVVCHAKAQTGGYVSWAGTGTYVHSANDTNCSSCHNGVAATGQTSPPHIPINGAQCSNCHANTNPSFNVPYYTMTHTAVVPAERCDACHNGTFTGQGSKGAIGTASYSGHVATNGADCVTCHVKAQSGGYVSWSGTGTFTHTPADAGICATCHNGTTATGETTPPHVPVSVSCDNCHSYANPSFTTPYYTMNHAAVHAERCDACHSGTYKKEGTQGAQGPDHSAKTQDCGCCHVKSTTNFSSWSNPQSSVAGCITTAKHVMPRSVVVVRNLLGATPTPIATPVARGALPGRGATPTPSPNARAPMVRAGEPTPGAVGRFGPGLMPTPAPGPGSHPAVTAACASCHNGVTAPGKPVNHVPTSLGCDTCHNNTRTFAGARFDHRYAAGQACATCHNGVIAQGKSTNHIPTKAACDLCHKSVNNFGGAVVDHKTLTAPCSTCHNTQAAVGKPARHVPTSAPCDACHINTADFAVVRFDHSAASPAPCAVCHNGVLAKGKGAAHIPTSAACDTCHRGVTTFAVSAFNHSAAAGTPCATCHDGRTAQGKPPNHAVTSQPCDQCHRGTQSWLDLASGVNARRLTAPGPTSPHRR